MATYIVSKNANRDAGIIGLSTAVFESIANSCISDVPDVEAAPNSTLKKSVSCKVINKKIVLNLNLVLSSSANVTEACALVKEKVFNEIAYMTNYKDVIININVVGFSFR